MLLSVLWQFHFGLDNQTDLVKLVLLFSLMDVARLAVEHNS